MLITIDLPKFEVASHELEYANEVIRIGLDVILFSSLWFGHGHAFCNDLDDLRLGYRSG